MFLSDGELYFCQLSLADRNIHQPIYWTWQLNHGINWRNISVQYYNHYTLYKNLKFISITFTKQSVCVLTFTRAVFILLKSFFDFFWFQLNKSYLPFPIWCGKRDKHFSRHNGKAVMIFVFVMMNWQKPWKSCPNVTVKIYWCTISWTWVTPRLQKNRIFSEVEFFKTDTIHIKVLFASTLWWIR